MARKRHKYFWNRLVEGVNVIGLTDPMRFDTHLQAEGLREKIPLIIEGREQPRILIDLNGAHFIAGVFLGALITAWKRVRDAGGEVQLCSSEPSVLEVFEITKLTKIFPLHRGRWDDPGLIAGAFRHTFACRPISPECRNWNDGVVGKIARVIEEEGAFNELPILADALEEAGCTDRLLLDHCRHAGNHLPGCWALELLGRIE